MAKNPTIKREGTLYDYIITVIGSSGNKETLESLVDVDLLASEGFPIGQKSAIKWDGDLGKIIARHWLYGFSTEISDKSVEIDLYQKRQYDVEDADPMDEMGSAARTQMGSLMIPLLRAGYKVTVSKYARNKIEKEAQEQKTLF